MRTLDDMIRAHPDWVRLTIVRQLRVLYLSHKHNARKRGIPFQLPFLTWCDIWITSGHLHERGNRRGKYCMSRNEDKGAYAVGNVSIILVEQNNTEGSTGERNSNFGLRTRTSVKRKISATKALRRESRGF